VKKESSSALKSKALARRRVGEFGAETVMKTEKTVRRSTRSRLRIASTALAFWIGAFSAPGVSRTVEPEPSLAGRLLVATPDMRDPRFVETIIYMVKHGAEGAMGIVINRPLAKGTIEDLLKGIGAESKGAKGEIVIHYGGPVSPEAGFLLHSDDVLLDSSNRVKEGIAMTSDAKLIEALARGKGPRQWLFAFGYAGWAPGQLEGELKAKAWFVVSADKGLIFGRDAEKKWRQAIDKRQIPL
jgi:putative transcriptional regulator